MQTTLLWILNSRTNLPASQVNSQVVSPARNQVHSRRLSRPTSHLNSPACSPVLLRQGSHLHNPANNRLHCRRDSRRGNQVCNRQVNQALIRAPSRRLTLRINHRCSRLDNLPHNPRRCRQNSPVLSRRAARQTSHLSSPVCSPVCSPVLRLQGSHLHNLRWAQRASPANNQLRCRRVSLRGNQVCNRQVNPALIQAPSQRPSL